MHSRQHSEPHELRRDIPAPVDTVMDSLVERFERAPHVLCGLDFDGTLAPIVDEPGAARMTEANRRIVETLSRNPRVTVAIVSGRGLDDLRPRIEPPVLLAGNHGLEIDRPTAQPGENSSYRRAIHPIAARASREIATCCGVLETTFADVPAVAVEHKRLSGTVHYRTAPDSLSGVIESRVRETLDQLCGDRVRVSTGKSIVEFAPAIEWGKGSVVELFERECPPDTLSVFIGDDRTDEDAFEIVEPDGVGVLVGPTRPSRGSVRLETPDQVPIVLRAIDSHVDHSEWCAKRNSHT
ncbi:trehalose-phosphatase [Halovivax gelatinilyticus]|uniref:trehalose-phosphatase n=1 Tax=Halovivax gelatinilyticus TaxID=2961597 RepID=UPI0020CA8A39|nr:trehalose-phosphatase [Halovivax gelatinilyticus]